MSKKIAVVGLPGKWSTEVLAEAVVNATGSSLIVDMGKVRLDLNSGDLIYGEHNLSKYDAILVKKISENYSPNTLDRLELLRVAEKQGVRVYSPALNILRLIDRLSCTVTLANHGIPMPETVITEDVEEAQQTVEKFGEVAFKPLYSTKARGMCVLSKGDSQLKEAVEAFKKDNPMMYIQKKMNLNGKDYGMVFLGGEYLGTYARVSQSDNWNTTINSGGVMKSIHRLKRLLI